MKMKKIAFLKFGLLLCFLHLNLLSAVSATNTTSTNSMDTLHWAQAGDQGGGLQVNTILDERFPTYSLSINFQGGSLAEISFLRGAVFGAFELLRLGTPKYSEEQLADLWDYYATELKTSVDLYSVSVRLNGPIQELENSVELVCHLLSQANYPAQLLEREKKRLQEKLANQVQNHSGLALQIFKQLLIESPEIPYPITGKISDIGKWTPEKLEETRRYFLSSFKKRLYFSGPKMALEKLEKVWKSSCDTPSLLQGQGRNAWDPRRFVASQKYRNGLYLVTVPEANQAQIIVGKSLSKQSLKERDTYTVATTLLGGSFSSLLNQAIRVERGLSYGARAAFLNLEGSGAILLSTSTENKNVPEVLSLMKRELERLRNNKVPKKKLDSTKNFLKGSFPLRLEDPISILGYYEDRDKHQEPRVTPEEFLQQIQGVSLREISSLLQENFSFFDSVILVLGDKSLLPLLEKMNKGKPTVLSYKEFLE